MNNAGISLPPGIPIDELTEEQWDLVMNVNLKGTFFGCKYAVPELRRRGGGCILNVSSGASLGAYPGVPAYSASKGGMNALGRSLAIDLGRHNIRVNTLCPSGGMSANILLSPDAPQVDEDSQWKDWDPANFYAPLWRDHPPRMIEHAHVALFLVSPAASFLSGVALPSDGGMAAKAAVDVSRLMDNWSTMDRPTAN
jgi:NAD(P)-dependent dehydrogenase (short-subunit alcohol dehydrogenase family)